MIAAALLFAVPIVAPPHFDAIRFFTGATEGEGKLSILFHHPRAIRVHGRGYLEPDGTLTLDQRVEQEGRPITTRIWHLRERAPGHYDGTLTDATGPVTADRRGDRLHIAYRAKGGVRIDQWLTLSADGHTAQNRLAARKLGLVVARLDETIRKGD